MDHPDVATKAIPISQARQALGELVNLVYKRNVRIVVEKSGIPVVAMVALSDFERWVQLDRERDSSDAVEAEVHVIKETAIAKSPSKEDLAYRQAVVAKILASADVRGISPVTSAELVNRARHERAGSYERWTR